jgi:hypothetical protein
MHGKIEESEAMGEFLKVFRWRTPRIRLKHMSRKRFHRGRLPKRKAAMKFMAASYQSLF